MFLFPECTRCFSRIVLSLLLATGPFQSRGEYCSFELIPSKYCILLFSRHHFRLSGVATSHPVHCTCCAPATN
ncbi:hypothetical protein EDB19DRAFT_798585 [Suillus lakei]|nr:hypothetical protein EDB19DRAFT_798585 [Suillus lakei]